MPKRDLLSFWLNKTNDMLVVVISLNAQTGLEPVRSTLELDRFKIDLIYGDIKPRISQIKVFSNAQTGLVEYCFSLLAILQKRFRQTIVAAACPNGTSFVK